MGIDTCGLGMRLWEPSDDWVIGSYRADEWFFFGLRKSERDIVGNMASKERLVCTPVFLASRWGGALLA